MSQKLILPLNDLRITAAYKNVQYKTQFGFSHYGTDCISTGTAVHACGNGRVIAAGMDGLSPQGDLARLGNVLVIVYRDVQYHDGTVGDLACRMYHFDKISVQVGEIVTSNTVIGQYGATGRYVSGPHLHIEFDTDVSWPTYAYGVASGGKIIKAGTIDSTVNPNQIWYVDSDQQIRGAVNGWYSLDDLNLPRLPKEPSGSDYQTLYEKEKIRADQTQALADSLQAKQKAFLAELKSLIQKYE